MSGPRCSEGPGILGTGIGELARLSLWIAMFGGGVTGPPGNCRVVKIVVSQFAGKVHPWATWPLISWIVVGPLSNPVNWIAGFGRTFDRSERGSLGDAGSHAAAGALGLSASSMWPGAYKLVRQMYFR